ncbi:unnamed protein product [Effrenium voratum]|nr:unnamed protein product [Effrenium voratum]
MLAQVKARNAEAKAKRRLGSWGGWRGSRSSLACRPSKPQAAKKELVKLRVCKVGRKARQQLERYASLLLDWNAKINLMSREIRDEPEILHRHVLPCVAIPLAASFQPGETVLDVGTGGGLPGLVSAICAPQARFVLLDSQRKKVNVVSEISNTLGLQNVLPLHQKVERVQQQYDFVTGRAVTSLPNFVPLVAKNLRGTLRHGDPLDQVGPGILYLKGGDVNEEVEQLGLRPNLQPLSRWVPGYDGAEALLHFPVD